jgi:feruloyl esterase
MVFVAAAATADPPADPQARCRALKGVEIEENGTLIKVWGPFTNFVAAADGVPAYCQVTGYVAPNVGFEMRLPATSWNGKMLEVGCGGDCGYIAAGACRGPLERGYACIATDTGHRGQGGVWASNDLEALIDFAYRAIHVVAIAGREVVKRYYDTPPKHSYFFGCSTGGRQGLIEAQRFPWDFDGIISGAPWIQDSDSAMNYVWAARALRDEQGRPILSRADLELVHARALAACESDDGLADGIIGDPARCTFDPRTLVCAAGRDSACLTAAQAGAVRKVYEGPADSQGRKLFPRGAMPGSELNWIDYGSGTGYIDGEGGSGENENWAKLFFRYLVVPSPGRQWSPRDFNFDTDYQRFASGIQEPLFSAANPDLRKFRAAGGKLIVYQGWNDESTMPAMTIDYYEMVVRAMGGADFLRLYLVPGMNHCGGGDGAFAVDYLTALENWVERGIMPGALLATHPKTTLDFDTTTYAPLLRRFPIDAADVMFTRTLHPYSMKK